MVKDLQDLYEFSLSPHYQAPLDEVCKQTGVSIHERYDEFIFQLDKEGIEASGVRPRDIEELVLMPGGRFIRFCVAKIEFFKKHAIEQEFPQGEEVEQFDQKEKLLGFSRGILLMYAVEFLLGETGGQYLEEYAKKARIPNAKKYVKEVLRLIKQSG